MKKLCLIVVLLLTACAKQPLKTYSVTMYAKGDLSKYNTDCPGCHIEKFDRADVWVSELSNSQMNKVVDGCQVVVEDSLQMKNIQTNRYVPVTDSMTCSMLFNKEKSYLKAMGFTE